MKEHWESIYKEKGPQEVSWTQEVPTPSLEFIERVGLPKDVSIIDVGGGDSKLVDHLLERGYEDLSVLDLSEKALDKAKERLGEQAEAVEWIASDVLDFEPQKGYDLWHDRATFHFLTGREQVERYLELVEKAARKYLFIATFSDRGPEKCSGLPVEQYDEAKMERLFSEHFEKMETWRDVHVTPDGKEQEFLFFAAERKDE